MKLRDYQNELVALSAGSDNVLLQADTGSGKTPVIAAIANDAEYVICIAHRNILIKQISRELAKAGVKHDALSSKHTKRQCIIEHRKLGLGDSIIRPGNKWVASIDTLLSRYRRGLLPVDALLNWVFIVDEAHHMVEENKWGRLEKIFPNARIIGLTATPCRLDQVSLARGKGGVFDRLEQAPQLKQDSVRTLIERGHLSDFKCYSVPERIDEEQLKLGKHDYTYKSLEYETNQVVFEMAGDAVYHYRRLADGKQGLAFCVSIEIAEKTAGVFKDAGIASAAIHSKMGVADVARVFDLFERRIIQVLFNVDMIGEGVDVPAIEVLIMLRLTASFGLYRQWCGRTFRIEEQKPFSILIDHVGNIRRHGLPDKHIEWSLENPPQAEKSNIFPCPECNFLVKAWAEECPECGALLKEVVNSCRSTDVKYIDFDLVEVEREAIEAEKMAAAHEKKLREVLQVREMKTHSMGALELSVHKIKLWVAEACMQSGISIYELNIFFDAQRNREFWIDNFTLRDLNKNAAKCTGVYSKWLKSQ